MIDPSFDTVVHPYPPTMQELEVKYRDLENKLDMKTQQWEYAGGELRKRIAQIESFEDALKNNGWDFDSATLEDLAGYFDIVLQREYMVEITVRFSGNVTVPMDYDIDYLENELNADISKGYYSNSSVEIDLMEEEMEISVEEV
jgi:hypothetical protein